jgi:8-oxo-dGTP pyrophosphatase MutT (NUDIX family)
MKEHYKAPSAVILLLCKEQNGKKYVLLQRRQNTGFADGLWDFSCSGHVEYDEPMSAAAVREAKEELGIDLKPTDIRFMAMVHKRDREADLTYYNGYFYAESFSGTPHICEPEKCSDLWWCPIDNLPPDLIPDRLQAFKAWQDKLPYIEFGW